MATARGFTLIELMVTVAILSILAAAALTGFRQDQVSSQYKRFLDDARGALQTARNAAIDDQTLVDVEVSATEIRVNRLDQTTDIWEPLMRVALDRPTTELLEVDDRVCIFGFASGVQTPAQSEDAPPPVGCVEGTQVLRFLPDGSFVDRDSDFTAIANAGVTLWIANRQVSGNTKLAMIQMFPGGLIRAFNRTSES
ncbi:MAG: prepilin-type N-terminal cleavage/methylation domain-containing protein [Nannocystaceae bacterium]|nr:prepilin-type N-terminal cleavage/methylation domain-containing protein [Nannocystaceae bacterium]